VQKRAVCIKDALAKWQEQAFHRRLLLEEAAGFMPSEPYSTTAAARNVFSTTAVQLRLVKPTSNKTAWESESPPQRLVATANESLRPFYVQLLDALGLPVHKNLTDARMPIGVSANPFFEPPCRSSSLAWLCAAIQCSPTITVNKRQHRTQLASTVHLYPAATCVFLTQQLPCCHAMQSSLLTV
jgi:hypothetical protein